METNYSETVYRPRLEGSWKYVDFVCRKLHPAGIVLQNVFTRECQLEGENLLGLEIKEDRRMAETGNVYIETQEKSDPANPWFVPSGIYRKDNTWLFGIGDYRVFYIFAKSFLRLVHKDVGNKAGRGILPKETPTSRGFVIPVRLAEEWAARVFRWDEGTGGERQRPGADREGSTAS